MLAKAQRTERSLPMQPDRGTGTNSGRQTYKLVAQTGRMQHYCFTPQYMLTTFISVCLVCGLPSTSVVCLLRRRYIGNT